MFKLPTTATAPFCPSEVTGSVRIPAGAPLWRRALAFAGPGLLVSVGYVDPGNWATDIEAGSKFGFALLWVVVSASLAAILLQTLSLRVGLVTGKDLARLCHDHYGRRTNIFLWLMAELSIIACDLAEVLGAALALHLLFDLPLLAGAALTALDTLIVLGLKSHGFRQLEAIVLGLILTIATCFGIELALVGPDWGAVAAALTPGRTVIDHPEALYLAIGILGATVMPHNLYLHSSIVQTRRIGADEASQREAIRLSTLDAVLSLLLALLLNAAILTLAASAFHASGHQQVSDIENAHQLLGPVVGSALAPVLFAVALLAAGQNSTFTGTIAGQILMEGFVNLKIPCWQRRLATRTLALVPALLGIALLGDGAVAKLLVASQVVLSLQLPFALWPLLRFSNDRALMGRFANGPLLRLGGGALFVLISGANLWLVTALLG
ncbi:Nramp family divalent metal transporter [Phaeospirillum tilakii]|uniref:Divalent metal cation transporter MntH n=1 Tax=Phaeospirillum tilakii TaxID=741673 RepID=A0ABW5C7R2_9PROT